jgi:hypothetical protein
MPRKKRDGTAWQANFNFDAPTNAPIHAEAGTKPATLAATGPASAAVIRIVDHHRARHLEVVRKLLEETGVFRVR